MGNGFADEEFLNDLDKAEKDLEKATFPSDCGMGSVEKFISGIQIRMMRHWFHNMERVGTVNLFGKVRLPTWVFVVIIVFYFHAVMAGLNPLTPIIEAMKVWNDVPVVTTVNAHE